MRTQKERKKTGPEGCWAENETGIHAGIQTTETMTGIQVDRMAKVLL